MRLAALARDGLTYATNDYDVDRYRQLGQLASELFSVLGGRSADEFALELGRDSRYATPKVDVRGVVFDAHEECYCYARGPTACGQVNLIGRQTRRPRLTLPAKGQTSRMASGSGTPSIAAERSYSSSQTTPRATNSPRSLRGLRPAPSTGSI